MIFLVGHHASGKTETAKILAEQFNFLHFETSHIVQSYKQVMGPNLSMTEWETLTCRIQGPNAINQFILEAITSVLTKYAEIQQIFQDIVITGNRQLEGINYLYRGLITHAGLLSRPEKIIVCLHANRFTLYKRYLARHRAGDDITMTWNEFSRFLSLEGERGLNQLTHESLFLENTQESIELLGKSVQHFFHDRGYTSMKCSASLGEISGNKTLVSIIAP